MAEPVSLKNFPELRQTYDYDCGATALQSVLAYYGIDAREDQVMHVAKTTETGTNPQNMALAIEHYGLTPEAREMTLADVTGFIKRGIPVIILLQAWTETPNVNWKNDWEDGHYVIAIGYDDEKMLFEDPSAIERTYIPFQELLDRWHDSDVNGVHYVHYGIAVSGPEVDVDPELPEHMG